MHGVARCSMGWAVLVFGLTVGCGGGSSSDLGGADSDLPTDVSGDLPGSDVAPDADRDLGPQDPGPSDDLPADLPVDVAPDQVVSDLPSDPGPDSCPRLPAPGNRVRKVAVALPYDENGDPTNVWTLLDLSAEGTLSPTGPTFRMGQANWGDVVFTPDGAVGIVPQNDGTLGVFRVESDGTPTVVHAGFQGSFYADRVVMAPEGDHAWVLDGEWVDIGGGVYRVDIACDGSLSDGGRVLESKLPRAFLPLPGDSGHVVLAADVTLGSPADDDVHLLDWGTPPTRIGGTSAFANEALVSGAAVTPDGKYVLLGDNDEMSGNPNTIAVVAVDGDSLTLIDTIELLDPIVLLPAKDGGIVLAVSGYGDALFVLERDDGDAAHPFKIRGEVGYTGGKPQVPGSSVQVDRGPLSGLVLVTEVTGIRTVRMNADGTVTDLGVTGLGDSFTGMPGAIGVQP